jgi:UDP-glucose 4-epimerase
MAPITYLATGGEGFIGSTICRLTGALPYDLKSGNNILNTEQLAEAAQGATGIYHCAAKISVPESFEQPDEYYLHNVTGTKSVIQVAKEKGAKIVFSSSAAVYGESNAPAREEDECNPLSPYAENKRDGEALLRDSGVPSVILRYFNVYGPGQSAAYAGVITAFIRAALAGDDIHIHGDGNQARDFVFVEDVAHANSAAMESGIENAEVINIGSGTATTINELAENIIRLTNSSSRILHEEARPEDILYSQADVGKARELLDWKARISLKDGLKRTIDSLREA